MKYRWQLREEKNISEDFLNVAGNSYVIANLLLNRGINSIEKAKAYLNPSFYDKSSPYDISDLSKARDRILEAINKKEKITIFGDYDVDGVTATSCLLITLSHFTKELDFYIPNRLSEGYGLNSDAIKTIGKKHKAKLLITCDCGITNHKEIELANELGIDVIVTDHHALPKELPPAYAVLNPKLLDSSHKLHFLPGVGVAYKLAEAILESMNNVSRHCEESSNEAISKTFGDCRVGTKVPPRNDTKSEDLLDLVTLGMIADIVPLVDENRYLVQIGLEKLAKTKKVGLKELLRICGIRCEETENNTQTNTEHIGFGIAPRINAVGRLADASLAVKLFTTENLLEAIHIASELDIQNKQRQFICEETIKEAIELFEEQKSIGVAEKCIVLANKGWHHGVVGIVASRLVEKFSLPTLLLAIDEEQNIAKGSGRSIEKLNITEVLSECASHLEKFGGHKAACGLSLKLDKINDFIVDFKNCVNNKLNEFDLEPILNIDMELPLASVNSNLISKINRLAPFGLGNPIPIFSSEEVKIIGIRKIGKTGQHLKLILKPEYRVQAVYNSTRHCEERSDEAISKSLSQDSRRDCFAPNGARNDVVTFEALIWNYDHKEELKLDDIVKIAYTPKINFYNGEKFIQLDVKDWYLKRREKLITNNTIKILDFRGSEKEYLEKAKPFHKKGWICFAEIWQKDFHPNITYSRKKVYPNENLVLLEPPPEKEVLIELINLCNPSNVYFAFPTKPFNDLYPADVLKKLSGMLRYVLNSKGGEIEEQDLVSALGLTKAALAYAIEILVRIGFLSYKRTNGRLNINISNPSRQNFEELIEYSLLESQLKQISTFKTWLCSVEIEEIKNLLKQSGLNIEIALNLEARVVV